MGPKMSLAVFYTSLLLAIGLCIGAFACRNKGEQLEQDTYSGYIGISAAMDAKQRRVSYQKANALRPWEKEPYLLLLSVYAENGVFEKEESSEILSLYNGAHTSLTPDGEREVARSIALLLINGYDGEQDARLRMAMPFLETAAQGLEEVPPILRCYLSIGTFYRRYVWNADHQEVTAEEMRGLISEISGSLDGIMGEIGVYDRLGYAMAVTDLISSQRGVLAATVPLEDVQDVLARLYQTVPPPQSLQADASRRMAQALLDGKDTLQTMVLRAYGKEADDGS